MLAFGTAKTEQHVRRRWSCPLGVCPVGWTGCGWPLALDWNPHRVRRVERGEVKRTPAVIDSTIPRDVWDLPPNDWHAPRTVLGFLLAFHDVRRRWMRECHMLLNPRCELSLQRWGEKILFNAVKPEKRPLAIGTRYDKRAVRENGEERLANCESCVK